MRRCTWAQLLQALAVFCYLGHYSNLSEANDISDVDVPVIDISAILDDDILSSSYMQTALLIDCTMKKFGIFIATGHGLPLESIVRSHSIARDNIFSLPMDQKMNVSMASMNVTGRGYIGFGQESGVTSVFEPKEGYSYGFDWTDQADRANLSTKRNTLQQPNIWPSDFPSASSLFLNDYYLRKVHIAEKIARALSNHEIKYDDLGQGGDTISLMRIFHYFPFNQPNNSLKDQCIGSSPHTDWGFLTVISQDDVGGLQIYVNDDWVSVPIVPGALVINGGDYLSIVSNGQYKNPIHRVVCPAESNRLSFVLFFYPGYDTPLHIPRTGHSNLVTAPDFEYNTLIDGTSSSLLDGKAANTDVETDFELKFGDFIVRKWGNVFRTDKKV